LIKKCIHINVTEDTHVAFKSLCAREKLTMHEFLEECISRFIDGDETVERVAKEIQRQKRDRTIKRVTRTDADSVYKAINGEE
jgi:1-deoxy-D-xylulose 5-phosphate reductoisomerase